MPAILIVDIICLNAAHVISIELANLAPARAGRDNAPELSKLTEPTKMHTLSCVHLFFINRRPFIFHINRCIYFS